MIIIIRSPQISRRRVPYLGVKPMSFPPKAEVTSSNLVGRASGSMA
jgi:hypothetical protein